MKKIQVYILKMKNRELKFKNGPNYRWDRVEERITKLGNRTEEIFLEFQQVN